jgi:hypothetical protein
MTDIDARLSDYHRLLIREFAEEALPAVSRPSSQSWLSRHAFRLGVAAALAVALPLLALGISRDSSALPVKVHLPGLTITAIANSGVSPQLTAQQATTAALAYLEESKGSPSFAGYSVTTVAFEPDVLNVVGQCGAIYLPSPGNFWVIEATAPAQQGWEFVRATLLVDDDTGVASSAAIQFARTAPVPGSGGTPASCH